MEAGEASAQVIAVSFLLATGRFVRKGTEYNQNKKLLVYEIIYFYVYVYFSITP